MERLISDIRQFSQQHSLPAAFEDMACHWFTGLATELVTHQNKAKRPITVGIQGAQGSGKTTLAAFLVFLFRQHFHLNAVSLSLDDFYLTREQRKQQADAIHPLLETRGVPGTHDVPLACRILDQLLNGPLPVPIPRFDKATDDRQPEADWTIVSRQPDIVVLEGWCLGVAAQSPAQLQSPVNALESDEDADGKWRRYVNQQLKDVYPALFGRLDITVMLKAPSFECVFDWRLQQENMLKRNLDQAASPGVMTPDQLARFIQFYQRLTEHALQTLPARADYCYRLDTQRRITALERPRQRTKAFTANPQWLIFTDLDGTLLDHHTYRHDEADTTLLELDAHNIPVILASSKTLSELVFYRETLHNRHPFISENGAAVFIPEGYFSQKPADCRTENGFWVREFVDGRDHWQLLIQQLADVFQDDFITFNTAGIDGIIRMTGLDVHAAARAAHRNYGEPVCWLGNPARRRAFIDALQQQGAQVLEGGRFLHVSGHCDKGQALQWLTEVYQQNLAVDQLKTIALGDSQNDIAMLEAADQAIVIRSPVHPPPELTRQTAVITSDYFGPRGWATALSEQLDLHHPLFTHRQI